MQRYLSPEMQRSIERPSRFRVLSERALKAAMTDDAKFVL